MSNTTDKELLLFVTSKSKKPDELDPSISYSLDEAKRLLWFRGCIAWKLHDAQLDIYEALHRSDSQKFIINCSRRLGKSYLLCLFAIEYALQNPGVRICYAAPTAKAVKKIITPLFKTILDDCPSSLRPKWSAQDQVYKFQNGSEIHIAGTDAERAEALRGQSMHLGICDEAGFMDQLDYVVSDILMPQTLTTGGRLILASTPAKTPAHDFTKYAEVAERDGNYIKKTIYDNPLINKKTLIKFMRETDPNLTDDQAEVFYSQKSGPSNTTWQREYMAENKTDEDLAIIPEYDSVKNDIIRQVIPFQEGVLPDPSQIMRPRFFDGYDGMDIGYNDFTVVLFGYWDFQNALLVIEDEVVLNRMTTNLLAASIAETEDRLWRNKRLNNGFIGNNKQPYMRFSDVDLIVIGDLQHDHDITFMPTKKDNKEAAINTLRILVGNRQLIIDPKCKHLISHLKYGIWNKNKTSFEKSGDYGHFDAIDALIYLSRNIQRTKNPIPLGYGLDVNSQYVTPQQYNSQNAQSLKKLFSLKKYFKNWKD